MVQSYQRRSTEVNVSRRTNLCCGGSDGKELLNRFVYNLHGVVMLTDSVRLVRL